jgi:hypothetical protein
LGLGRLFQVCCFTIMSECKIGGSTHQEQL